MISTHRLPVAKSLFAPEALARLIEKEYGFADVRCRLIKATMRDTYLVRFSGGSAVACVYRSGARSVEEIEAELSLVDRVAGQTPSPIALTTRSGERVIPLVASEGPRHMTLMAYVAGAMSKRAAPPRLAGDVGQALARFHLACDSIATPLTRPMLDARWLLDSQLDAIREVLGSTDPRLTTLTDLAELAGSHIANLPTDSPGFGLIHGDVIPSNLLVTPNGELALLDFDLSGYGWRAYDLATYLHELEFWDASQESQISFIAGYETIRSLADWERRALEPFKITRAILGVGIPASHVDEWGTAALPNRLIDRFVTLAQRNSAW